MSAVERPRNRTTVRAIPWTFRAARAGFRFLGPTAPELAARYAEHLFLTARRFDRPSWEREVLAEATPSRVSFQGAWLPTWTWSPKLDRSCLLAEQRPAVVLVHGWEGRGSQLAAFVEPLLQAGLRVVTFDGPGHGDSPLARGSIIDHARAILAVVQSAGPVHGIIAHSVGGASTLLATRLGLRTQRFALIAPPIGPSKFTAGFAQLLGLDPAIKAGMIARLEDRYGMRYDELDACRDAAALSAPMLVVHDSDDPVVPWSDGDAIAAAAPHGRLTTTRGLGHRAILRAPPVVDDVVTFVRDGAKAPTFSETLEGELFAPDARW